MADDKEPGSIAFAIILVIVLVPLIYIVGGQFMGTVNNTPLTAEPVGGGSHVIEMSARMIGREVDSGFCPSAVLWPGHIRYDICGFQEGEQQIWQRLAIQLSDHLTREGAASDRDPDLNAVLANLNRPNTWSLIFSSNNTASLLGASVKKLDSFNGKLRDGKAGYYPRIDNLASLIGDMTSVLGGESKRLSEAAGNTGFYSMKARSAYFHGLGTMAASCWVMQAARVDFDDVLKMQSADSIYDQAMSKVCEKVGKNPAVVINAEDLSHLLTLSGSASAAVNDLNSLQIAIAAAPHSPR